jgi:hypothetical protein
MNIPSICAFAAVLLMMSGCGGGNADPDLTQVASGAVTPTESSTASGTIQMVDKLVVLDAQETVPGKMDYKLAPIVCNDQRTRTSQKVSLKYADSSATVLNADTTIGSSHYGQCRLNVRGAMEVRTDKAAGFDVNKISLTVEDTKPLASNPVRMIKVDLYQAGGRPGHAALLPLNTLYPKSGEMVYLRAILAGSNLSASYKVLAPNGDTLQESKSFAPPAAANPNGGFAADFVVPTVPFQLQIAAQDDAANRLVWTTEVYRPQLDVLRIQLQNAIFTAPGQTRAGTISGAAAKSGSLVVKLHLPAGLQSDWTQRTLAVTAGQAVALPFVLTAPTALLPGKFKVFAQYRYEQDTDVLAKAPVLINPSLH